MGKKLNKHFPEGTHLASEHRKMLTAYRKVTDHRPMLEGTWSSQNCHTQLVEGGIGTASHTGAKHTHALKSARVHHSCTTVPRDMYTHVHSTTETTVTGKLPRQLPVIKGTHTAMQETEGDHATVAVNGQ